MLARDVAGTALQGMRQGPVVSEGLGRLIGRQFGSLSFLENAAANVGRTAGMEQTGVALGALAGEGLEAAGLTALGAGTLPLSGAVGRAAHRRSHRGRDGNGDGCGRQPRGPAHDWRALDGR